MAHTAPSTGSGRQLSRRAAANQPQQLTPEQIAARDNARHEVDKVLKLHGLKTKPHFDEGPGEEKSLYVNVSFDGARRERATIVGLLEQQGWSPDPERLTRITFAIETIRVRHKQTGARMAVIVRVPIGDSLTATEPA